MDVGKLEEFANELIEAEIQKNPIEPITDREPTIEIPEAYEIQRRVVRIKEKEGQEVVGRKIGLTSKGMQEKMGVNEPDYGVILDELIHPEFVPLEFSDLIQPKVEAEIAFFLKEELKGPGVTIADIARASSGVGGCIEVIDSRIRGWNIKIQDTISDNASIGRVILGGNIRPLGEVNLQNVGLVVEKNGMVEATGAGAAVMGTPMNSAAWLVNKLAEYDDFVEPGSIVISGSFIPAFEVEGGDSVRASFGGLGSVSVFFG